VVLNHSVSRNAVLRVMFAVLLLATAADAQWLNHPSPGIPRLPDGKPNLSASAPKAADGKPDLSGIWSAECGVQGRDACFTQSLFFDLAKELNAADVQMTPWAQGIQTREVTAFLYETIGTMTFRQVFTDGRSLPQENEPTWLGYSVGRWDGDVFVVETAGFRDGGWLDTRKARPHSDALRVTERFRRTDFGHMQLTITIDDRKAFLKPWTVQARLTLLPDTELVEAFCDNHDKTMEHRRIEAVTEPPSPR
jgi:hypothetical protein